MVESSPLASWMVAMEYSPAKYYREAELLEMQSIVGPFMRDSNSFVIRWMQHRRAVKIQNILPMR